MSKGMVYTAFALLSASLILMMVSIPFNQNTDIGSGDATRIGDASFFIDSVLNDMERSLEISARRSLSTSINYVVESGEALAEPKENVTSALANGTISGEELDGMENASLDDWAQKVSDIGESAGYSLEVDLRDSSFENASGFETVSSYSVFARLKDPTTLASFNATKNATVSVSFEGLEDTLLLLRSQGRYASQYKSCGFDEPAKLLETGPVHSSGVGYGEAVVKPGSASGVSDPSEKVLVVEDVSSYNQVDVNNFEGVVSAQENETGGYTTEYVFDTGTIDSIKNGSNLVLTQSEVWRTSFETFFEENCYLEVDSAPDIFDRLGNNATGENGVATLVDVRDLPSELREVDSVVGYVYFSDQDFGGLNEIKGVSEEYSWLRIDDEHVDKWDLDPLVDE